MVLVMGLNNELAKARAERLRFIEKLKNQGLEKPEVIEIIQNNGLEFLCEISRNDKDFAKKLANSLEYNFSNDYYLVVPDDLGNDVKYKVYRKQHPHSTYFNEPP